MIEANRDTIILALERVFELRPVQAEKLFAEVLQCVRKRDLVSFIRSWFLLFLVSGEWFSFLEVPQYSGSLIFRVSLIIYLPVIYANDKVNNIYSKLFEMNNQDCDATDITFYAVLTPVMGGGLIDVSIT